VQAGDAERVGVLRVCWSQFNRTLGLTTRAQTSFIPTNGSVVGTGKLRLRECFGGRLRRKSQTGWNEKNRNSCDKRT
jgi:hypothetical protein